MLGANDPPAVGSRLPRVQLTLAKADGDWNAHTTAANCPSFGNYLNDLSSSFQAVQFCLSLFAIFVIFRHCVQRWSTWLTRIDAKNAAYSTTNNPNFSPNLLTIEKGNHQRFSPRHRLQPPLPWFYHLPEMMDEKQRDRGFSKTPTGPPSSTTGAAAGAAGIKVPGQQLPPRQEEDALATGRNMFALNPTWNNNGGPDRHLISRPPPAPPLTPPDFSNTVYTLEGRPMSQGVPDSFLHQPNPDYTSASFSTMSSSQVSGGSSHRRSYSKTVPIGIPRRQSSMSEPDQADLTISPNSYPPTSPILPPPPPSDFQDGPSSDREGQPSTQVRHEVDAHGQLVSVRNSDGVSWTRHTRVYGGGVCLACAAAGREGGFYGANVRPEEMR